MLRVQISARQILPPKRYKKESTLTIVLFFEIEDTGSGLIIEVKLLILFLRVVVEICMIVCLPVMCPNAISEFRGE